MKSLFSLTCAVSLGLALVASGPLAAASNASGKYNPSAQANFKSSLSPAERGRMAHDFVSKWGPYVQKVYGLDVRSWSERMVATFASADPTNFQRALQRSTYEGAIAELDGTGTKLTDAKVIDTLAKSAGTVTPSLIGDATIDLVYTPITPCRIIDTRSGGGVIVAGGTRDFSVWGQANYTAQGGSATNCGLQTENPAAAVLNVTAVFPAAAGYATLYAYNTVKPLAASVNYGAGAIVNNSLIVPLAPGAPAKDFTVYTFAQSHFVVDVVGYFDEPHATGLECVAQSGAEVVVADTGNATRAFSGTCPATYTHVSTQCYTTASEAVVNQVDDLGCYFMDKAPGNLTTNNGRAENVCCRIPGR